MKPDLEALLRLPVFPGHPTGALLALGSGSRRPAAPGVARLARSVLSGVPHVRSTCPAVSATRYGFPELNIEARCGRDELRCCSGAASAIRETRASTCVCATPRTPGCRCDRAASIMRIETYELGSDRRVPLFSAMRPRCPRPDGFAAITEDARTATRTVVHRPAIGSSTVMADSADCGDWSRATRSKE